MISFIVPAHNEEAVLAETLCALNAAARALVAESDQQFEVIVVSDASTDRTPEIARENGARLVEVNHRQIAATRNAGAKVANGDLLFFVDADTLVSVELLREATSLLANKNGKAVAGGGARVRLEAGMPLWVRALTWLFSAIYFSLNLGAGCFLFVRREVFEAIDGFDERLFAAEETYLSIAIKKHGKFRLTRMPVTTSGRKFRIYPARKLFGQLFIVLFRGKRALMRRDTLDIWYDGGREK